MPVVMFPGEISIENHKNNIYSVAQLALDRKYQLGIESNIENAWWMPLILRDPIRTCRLNSELLVQPVLNAFQLAQNRVTLPELDDLELAATVIACRLRTQLFIALMIRPDFDIGKLCFVHDGDWTSVPCLTMCRRESGECLLDEDGGKTEKTEKVEVLR